MHEHHVLKDEQSQSGAREPEHQFSWGFAQSAPREYSHMKCSSFFCNHKRSDGHAPNLNAQLGTPR